ncbi:hypothetical protein NVP1022O_26 [Vibrio phage 1.022.O._10N.286.45.A10]|nr:hypothetical protein NVP1022O_26 [Vibrio phage 1.022.O._10N.286.45.A10]
MAKRLTTEEFIEKARAVHGDRYSYERAVYVNTRSKVVITCPVHGGFEQTPNSHLRGDCCPKCGTSASALAQSSTTEEFVEKARLVHGSRYGYESTVYVRNSDKVTITCIEHGDFEQRPNGHLLGNGCSKCATLSKASALTPTTEEFIEKARAVHGDRYSYDRTVYVRALDKVTITCPEHGDFEQRPASHLTGRGCAKCRSDSDKLTTEEFIEKARAVHGSRYGYERAVYVTNRKKLTITCPGHGDFNQTPHSHLGGSGCAKCADITLTTEEFIEKARAVHGNAYGYDRTVYVTNKKKVTLTCPEHGDFEQTPNTHLSGCGCHKCATRGFNPDKQAYLYILLDTETHSRVKIGISNVPDRRLRDLKRETPFPLERIDLFETPPTVTLQLEKFCHSQLESANLTGFDGATEWFQFDGGKLEALRAFILSTGGAPVGG